MKKFLTVVKTKPSRIIDLFQKWDDLLENESFDEITHNIKKGNLNTNSKLVNGLTPLHIACIQGNFKGVKFLLKNKANPNTTSNYGRTPLQEAIFYGHKECINILLSKSGKHGNSIKQLD